MTLNLARKGFANGELVCARLRSQGLGCEFPFLEVAGLVGLVCIIRTRTGYSIMKTSK